jgi:hypothetical protein
VQAKHKWGLLWPEVVVVGNSAGLGSLDIPVAFEGAGLGRYGVRLPEER